MMDECPFEEAQAYMSDEEHKARAMLMGWKYFKGTDYYIDTKTAPFKRYDRVTLELLDEVEVCRRQNMVRAKIGYINR